MGFLFLSERRKEGRRKDDIIPENPAKHLGVGILIGIGISVMTALLYVRVWG
jgi:hypothetical protein